MKFWKIWITATALLLTAACANADKDFGESVGRLTPVEPPTFLTAEVANLFGNAQFTARLEVQNGLHGTRSPIIGELSGRDGSLYFIADEQRSKRGISGGLSALWHAPTKTAYLLNDPLQAYAPIRNASALLTAEPTPLGEEEVNGERCRKSVITQPGAAGEAIPKLIVWRAIAQQDLPIRIQTTNSTQAVTLTLSRIRHQAPAPDFFALPSGFKAYESTDAMLNELIRRRTQALDARSRSRQEKYGSPRIDGEDPMQNQRQMRPY
jgi:hypothetical protein